MASLHISITMPRANEVLDRTIRVEGRTRVVLQQPGESAHVTSVEVRLGDGSDFGTATRGNLDWDWWDYTGTVSSGPGPLRITARVLGEVYEGDPPDGEWVPMTP